jgi:multimeric flavodoxin WrbA
MKALILDASPDGSGPLAAAALNAAGMLRGADVNVRTLVVRDMNIQNCCGRFDCWVKTPGECATRDDGRLVGRELTDADLLVLVTRVSFGGYSALAKSAMDRCLPALLPFMELVCGEVHHPARGGRVKRLAVFGGLESPDPETESVFRRIVDRNALNMRSPAHAVAFVYDTDDDAAVGRTVVEVLTAAGVSGMGVAP